VEAGAKRQVLLWSPALVGAGGDPFRALYVAHYEDVRSVLWRLGVRDELDDLVQEVFLRVCDTWHGFRGDATPRTWITRIAINIAKDHFKRRRFELTDGDVDAPPDPRAARDLLTTRAIEHALQSLAYDARTVFVLCMIEGYSMSEAAEILSVPQGTVKSRLHYAKREVRARLEEAGVGP
jgi:RNA polymerase sigma-70 factor (ECF subfamily)